MLIILLLVLISEFTFFMDAEDDFPDRLNTSITLILASVAFLYVASESLPKISYLTLLDKFVMSQTLLIVLSAFEHGFGHQEYDLIVFWVTVGLWIATHLYFAARAFAVKRLQRKQRRTRQSDRLSQRRLGAAVVEPLAQRLVERAAVDPELDEDARVERLRDLVDVLDLAHVDAHQLELQRVLELLRRLRRPRRRRESTGRLLPGRLLRGPPP